MTIGDPLAGAVKKSDVVDFFIDAVTGAIWVDTDPSPTDVVLGSRHTHAYSAILTPNGDTLEAYHDIEMQPYVELTNGTWIVIQGDFYFNAALFSIGAEAKDDKLNTQIVYVCSTTALVAFPPQKTFHTYPSDPGALGAGNRPGLIHIKAIRI